MSDLSLHRSLICGVASDRTGVRFGPVPGAEGQWFEAATPQDVEHACQFAHWAFESAPPAALRAALLEGAAARIAALGDTLIDAAVMETGLAAPRLASERDRTVSQLRMFAQLIRDNGWMEIVVEPGDPGRTPLPRPDLRRMLRPLGPVAVFGASNFPLAYSVAGGDSASALAAGCPVVVKGHAAHPLVGALVARAVSEAVVASGVHPGFFSFLHSGGEREREVGSELVQHPFVQAVGFTGSVAGGQAIGRLVASRPEPVPLFAEMGSVNPVFVMPAAARRDGAGIAAKLAASIMNSSGQMCTCPGLVFVCDGPGSDEEEAAQRVVGELAKLVAAAAPMPMLTPSIGESYARRLREIGSTRGVAVVAQAPAASEGETTAGARARGVPTLFGVSIAEFDASPALFDECFGAAAIVVRCSSVEQFHRAATLMPGSLTGSVFVDPQEHAEARPLLEALADRVGRIIVNGVPTGVEVSRAMVHSGPFPACSRPDSTAVGAFAIRRWLRPVCWQNVPPELLPPELR